MAPSTRYGATISTPRFRESRVVSHEKKTSGRLSSSAFVFQAFPLSRLTLSWTCYLHCISNIYHLPSTTPTTPTSLYLNHSSCTDYPAAAAAAVGNSPCEGLVAGDAPPPRRERRRAVRPSPTMALVLEARSGACLSLRCNKNTVVWNIPMPRNHRKLPKPLPPRCGDKPPPTCT